MIKASKMGVEIKGSDTDILYEFCFVVYGVRNSLIDVHGKEVADKMIADMGRIAVKASDSGDFTDALDELCSQLAEETAELMMKGDE